MDEVTLEGVNGRSLSLRLDSAPDADAVWRYVARLSLPEGTVTSEVWDIGPGLAAFFRDVASSWQGFDGVKEYGSLEGQLLLSCRHDGVGTVECTVTLCHQAPPKWLFQADLQFGAGAHLERLAGEIEEFVAST
jgi:Family of unknown function (DUF6228)